MPASRKSKTADGNAKPAPAENPTMTPTAPPATPPVPVEAAARGKAVTGRSKAARVRKVGDAATKAEPVAVEVTAGRAVAPEPAAAPAARRTGKTKMVADASASAPAAQRTAGAVKKLPDASLKAEAAQPRRTKQAVLIELLQRREGATIT